jgi:alanine-glyoxylate transaminase/serine-glyoxylate transaminase/serine-pyruvate transaminase
MLTTAMKPIAPPKRLIFGPGPSMIYPRVYAAMSQPLTGIRDPYFLSVIAEIQSGLREVFGTRNAKTFLIPASGSGAMEAAVSNFVPEGSKFAVFTAGYFADRIAAMGERHRANVVRCAKEWGEVFTEEEASQFIERERPDVVAFVQGETSTGAYQSGRAISEPAHRFGALVMADCVASLGAMPVELDTIGIDIAFSCSQKGLSCPAGLSPISISPRAWEWLTKRKDIPVSWYFDLLLLANYFEEPHVYHHTPSPPLYYAVREGLAIIEEEGLRERWERHRLVGQKLTAELIKLGFEPLVKDAGRRLWHLTVVTPPDDVDEAKLRDRLMQKYGIEIAGGLGKLAGKILRIGTMGPTATEAQAEFLLDAIAASI